MGIHKQAQRGPATAIKHVRLQPGSSVAGGPAPGPPGAPGAPCTALTCAATCILCSLLRPIQSRTHASAFRAFENCFSFCLAIESMLLRVALVKKCTTSFSIYRAVMVQACNIQSGTTGVPVNANSVGHKISCRSCPLSQSSCYYDARLNVCALPTLIQCHCLFLVLFPFRRSGRSMDAKAHWL